MAEKYITPLRRKGFTGPKFYQVDDPTYSDGRRRVKTEAYKAWLKEQHALPKPKHIYKRTVRPELDESLIKIAEAMREADNTQDFEYLMRDVKATKQIQKEQDASRKDRGLKKYKQRVYKKGMIPYNTMKVLGTLETDPASLKIIADSLGEDTDWVLDILDEKDQYIEDVRGERKVAREDPKYKKPRNDYLKVENWVQKNAKRYTTPESFEKALRKRFGNKNQFIMDMGSNQQYITGYFSDDFKKTMFNTDPATGIRPKHLKQFIQSSLYNFNPKIKAKVTEEIKKIFSAENLPKLRTEARKMIRNNPTLKMFGMDKQITGPFPKVIQAVIGRKIWDDLQAFRRPRVTTYEMLKAFEDLVAPKFKPMFKESAKAILHSQNNQWKQAKDAFGIADSIAWDHKVPSSLIRKGYADIIEYTKVNPTTAHFNERIKNAQFDRQINKLIPKYEAATDDVAKAAVVEEMNKVKSKFNEKYGNYLGEVDIKLDEKGNLRFSSTTQPLTTKMDRVEMLNRSLLQEAFPNLSKPVQNKFLSLIAEGNAGGPICGLVRKKSAIGGPQTPGCGDEVRQALQDDPDKLIQEAADSKVKSGQSTKFRTIARQILSKIPKGGKIGALVAGAGAVGLGTYAMMGDAEADETQTTDQSTMKYNSTTGTFDNIDGDPEDQTGILNWIADNPAKAGFSALPAWMGLGYGLSTAGMKKAGQHLMSWKAIIPAMMIPEKMHQWKSGMEAGEMATDPFNALWALGIRNQKSLDKAADYYRNMLKQGQRGLDMTTLKNLKSVQGWKNLPGAMRTALMSPAATGTDLAFQKRLKPALKKLTESVIGSPGAKQAAKKGLGALAKRVAIGVGAAALLPATVAAGLVSAPLTLGLGALSFGYAQYKDYRDGKAIVDAMRAKGKISEEDADKYMSLIKQGSLPFGLGNRLFGDDEMTIRGQALNPEQQRGLLAGMESQIDLFQEGRRDVRALDRADDFDFFSEGGRVGMKFGGGMDRRGFLKWLAGLGATIAGGASGLFKTGAKKGIEQVVKQAPKKFIGVEGMPAWFPRAVQKIKTHGKLIEMADKHYVNGDIYEMILPTKVPKFDMVAGKQKMSGFQTVNKKVLLEENPVSGEIEISWNVDDFDGDMKRQINFRPGESGFQKFGADVDNPGAWEFQRVKVEEPEFTYGNPDQSLPERDSFDYKDIFEDGDEVVKALENLTGNKKMVAKDGSIIDTVDEKGIDEAFQNKMYKDIEGEGQILPDPEGHMTPHGWQGEKGNEIIGGEIPEKLYKKAEGGTVETGDIARRQSLVPPLAGPDPQGIMGLYSEPKQVRVG